MQVVEEVLNLKNIPTNRRTPSPEVTFLANISAARQDTVRTEAESGNGSGRTSPEYVPASPDYAPDSSHYVSFPSSWLMDHLGLAAALAGPGLGGADPPGGGGPPPGGAGAVPDEAARRLIEAQKHALRSIASLPKFQGDGKISYRIFESSWKIHWEIHGLNNLNVHTQKLALLSSFVGEAIEKSRLARPGERIFDGAGTFDQYAVAVHDLFLPPQESELSKSEFLQCVQL